MMPYCVGLILHLCFLNFAKFQTITESNKLNDSSLHQDVSLNRIKKDAPVLTGPLKSTLLISHPSLAHLLPEEDSAFIQLQQTIHIPNDLKTNTFPFIEAIVRRTVNKYMNVIRTQSNWLELLLQLVREEREIRSRYNCFTDACIYKIQLFTSQLKLANPGAAAVESVGETLNLAGGRLKRPRRSVDFEPLMPSSPSNVEPMTVVDPLDESSPKSSESTPLSSNDIVQVDKNVVPVSEPIKVVEEFHDEDDDALRLLDETESKRLNNQESELQPNNITSSNQSRFKATQIDDHSKVGVTRFSQEQNKFLSQQNPEITKFKQSDDLSQLSVLTTTAAMDTVTTLTGFGSASQSESDLGINSNLPRLDIEASKINADVPMDPDGVIISEPDLTMDKEPELATHKEDGSDVLNESQPIKPAIEMDPLVPVIPFGLNKFEGESYENCTGRYENYCYNAIKCVYISVLETAACYCRTGYTGVRCDMYNLPQTLDIFKSFGERIVDFSSMQKLNVFTVYSVVEATARYTVNAVLEEKLLQAWEDEGPF